LKIKIISIGNKMPSWINEAFDSYISKLDRDFSTQLIEIKPEKKFDSVEQKKNWVRPKKFYLILIKNF